MQHTQHDAFIFDSEVVADEKWNQIKLFLQKADKDGNGVLSQDEFRYGLVTLGVPEEKAAAVVEWVCLFH